MEHQGGEVMEALGALVEQEVEEEVEVMVGGVVAEVATETEMGTITPIQVDGLALQGSVDVVVMMGQMDQMESEVLMVGLLLMVLFSGL